MSASTPTSSPEDGSEPDAGSRTAVAQAGWAVPERPWPPEQETRLTIRTHSIGSQGLEASVEGLGTMGMTAMYGTRDDAGSVETIQRAIDLGVTLFDTADMYGPFTGEELLGRAVAPYRDRVLLATKFGGLTLDESGKVIGGPNGRPEYLRRAVEGSLRRLGTDRVDLYYQHRVDPHVPVTETFGALGELVAEGKVRYLGISPTPLPV
ncbi:aldo/keto reductase [Streptomyces flaveolus]|uniref:aldo/keto reductase n=1 Tax=Streptomyces flaveolus TaxID=67297 RepID=UPI0033DD070B